MSIGKRELVGAVAALALALLGSTIGCRSEHLGKDTGRAYRQAFEQQAEPKGEGPALSAEDATRVMHAHSEGKAKKSGDGTSAPAATPAMSSGSSSSGAWPGATGNISLEAK
ncbi:MAG TPA: hypothetical protein VML75_03355 [Kofleriaceae bacterium]|nr:hypothetical protein [Kofleriaceae bacterium]